MSHTDPSDKVSQHRVYCIALMLVLCTHFPSGRVGIAQLLQLASLPILNRNASTWLTMPSPVPVGHPTPLRLPVEYPGQLLFTSSSNSIASSAVLLMVGESSGIGIASSLHPITESVARTHSQMVIWTMTLFGLWYFISVGWLLHFAGKWLL